MKKVMRTIALVILPLVATANASSFGYREAAYVTTMYSDATYTTVVGQIVPECGYFYIQYGLVGEYTYFQQDEFVGYCTETGWEQI